MGDETQSNLGAAGGIDPAQQSPEMAVSRRSGRGIPGKTPKIRIGSPAADLFQAQRDFFGE
ncbi:MAG: hypothetical protein ACLFWF_06810 [Alphaproteobacteria bacterium]